MKDCAVCKELKRSRGPVRINELYDTDSGYFYPDTNIIIHFCPNCGKEIKYESVQRTNRQVN